MKAGPRRGPEPPEAGVLVAALDSPRGDPQLLGSAALARLARSSPMLELLAWPLEAKTPYELSCALLEEPLAQALLRRTVVAHEGLEALLTRVRRQLLARRESRQELLLGLAHQAWNNGYLWAVTEGEREALRHSVPPLLRACYTPEPDAHPSLAERQRHEPEQERRLATELPTLTPICDSTSRRVAAQYEELPFPRFLGYPQPGPYPFSHSGSQSSKGSLADHLRRLFPQLELTLPTWFDSENEARRTVLIAGCGTGRHALAAAARYREPVLAVDLSRASLAYGLRLAQRDAVENLSFAQADLLELASWGRRFGAIECVGVLHHLARPQAGLAALLSCLEPGGLLRLGLYSRRGRACVEAARAELGQAGLTDYGFEGLIRARQRILELPREHPARGAARFQDFYSRSGARDLLFPAQETTFDLAQVEALLAPYPVRFLGFEEPGPGVLEAFRRLFPEAGSEGRLGLWGEFERLFPSTFRGMYQFWLQKDAVFGG